MQHIDGHRAKLVAKTVIAAIGAATLLLAMSGCATIPQRAWQNGAAMSARGGDAMFMYDWRGFQTMRQTYSSMSGLPFAYDSRPYPYFGRW
jgi:hypothetical protein